MSTTFHHPATDGQTERISQTMEDMLRACAIAFQGSWEDQLDLIEFSYNNSYHASIKMAPLRHYMDVIVEVPFAGMMLVRMYSCNKIY